MLEKIYNVIGVMSGTSLDGIDCAYAKITLTSTNPNQKYPSCKAEIGIAETITYPNQWKDSLAKAHSLSKQKLTDINETYTAYLATVINRFISKNTLTDIDAVCSHGHTILHQPEKGFTLQIGNLKLLAQHTNQKIVCDFRVQDVEMGGQGAPLVPIGDRLLFGAYEYCLNLGGFANVSTERNGVRIAYDICPVNVVLNRYSEQLGEPYDNEGAFAKAGSTNLELLEALNKLSFYKKKAPKSLGIEWVHEHIFPLIDRFDITPKDVLTTFTEHIAIQLAAQFSEKARVLITGGGAYNSYLMERLLHHNPKIDLVIPETNLIEFKEALIFALLGVLKIEDLPNCLASVTGATEDHSSGTIFLP